MAQHGSKTNNSNYSSTSYPHHSSHCRPKPDGGGHLPSGLPVLGCRRRPPRPNSSPHPWDPAQVPSTDAAAPLFLPPALSLIHPALSLCIPSSIFVHIIGNVLRDCSLLYIIIILRLSHFRLGNPNLVTNGSTRCAASTPSRSETCYSDHRAVHCHPEKCAVGERAVGKQARK